jgi:bacterioferritin
MKGNKDVIAVLNELLADELTAINQYMVHSEMCDNWGYERLHKAIEKRAIVEMKHAEKLIARILFLEGVPVVSRLKDIHIGPEPKDQLERDMAAEVGAVAAYNGAIRVCEEKGDHGTRELLDDVLEDEEEHLDWIEAQLDQIRQMGVGTWLLSQSRAE